MKLVTIDSPPSGRIGALLASGEILDIARARQPGTIEAWSIVALSILLGVINGFDIPVRQSFVHEMIENREDLPNAIALNSSMFNAARLVGPSIAGIVLAAIGEGMCFLVNAVSFVAYCGELAGLPCADAVQRALDQLRV